MSALVLRNSGGGGGGSITVNGKKRKVYSAARKPTAMTSMRVPRTIKLNGEYKMTRVTNMQITYDISGFSVGGTVRPGIGFIFDPTQVTCVSTLVGGTIPATVPNYSEMSALWERVRIDKVVCQVSSVRTDPLAGVAGNVSTPIVYFAYDETDVYGNTLSTTQQQAGCRSWHATGNLSDFYFTVYPKYQRIIYYTSTISSYEPAKGFVVSDTAIPHYGLKCCLDNNLIGSGVLNFRFTYHYTFKDVK